MWADLDDVLTNNQALQQGIHFLDIALVAAGNSWVLQSSTLVYTIVKL